MTSMAVKSIGQSVERIHGSQFGLFGIFFLMADYFKYATITVFLFTIYVIFKREAQVDMTLDEEIHKTVRDLYNAWNKCIINQIKRVKNHPIKLWERIGDFSGRCDKYTGLSQLPIFEYPNLDDSKFHMLPVNVNDASTIVSIGIGRDVSAEQKLKQDLGNNASFYGADPIAEKNKELFEPLGKFFSLAISGYTGLKTASVLTEKDGYKNVDVTHVDLVQFLTKTINPAPKVFDNILIDAEGGEFSMMPFFYRGGSLDQHNVTICQFNMEEFINRIIEDKRYLFSRLTSIPGQWRLYFLNMDNILCSKKYLVDIHY